MIGAMKGYKVIIMVSEKISQEKLQIIQAYGAQTVMCSATHLLKIQKVTIVLLIVLHRKHQILLYQINILIPECHRSL
jgi:cysteine synthase